MMPTSASCRRASTTHLRIPDSGFSLLELLVVLALVSIMTAVVAPRLLGTVDAIAVSGERAEVTRQLESLPLVARRSGHAIEVAADAMVATAALRFPDNWTVHAITPLAISAHGVCSAASVRVQGRDMVEEWSLRAPDCRVRDGS